MGLDHDVLGVGRTRLPQLYDMGSRRDRNVHAAVMKPLRVTEIAVIDIQVAVVTMNHNMQIRSQDRMRMPMVIYVPGRRREDMMMHVLLDDDSAVRIMMMQVTVWIDRTHGMATNGNPDRQSTMRTDTRTMLMARDVRRTMPLRVMMGLSRLGRKAVRTSPTLPGVSLLIRPRRCR